MADPTTARSPHRWTTILNGPLLRQLRRQRGLSQEQLADQAGISLATVSRLECQIAAACRGRTLARLAAALGKDAANLTLAGEPERRSNAEIVP